MYEREIVVEPFTVESGQFRLGVLTDPSANTINLTQTLDPPDADRA